MYVLSQVHVVLPVPAPSSVTTTSVRSANGGQSHCAKAPPAHANNAVERKNRFMVLGCEVNCGTKFHRTSLPQSQRRFTAMLIASRCVYLLLTVRSSKANGRMSGVVEARFSPSFPTERGSQRTCCLRHSTRRTGRLACRRVPTREVPRQASTRAFLHVPAGRQASQNFRTRN